MRPWTRATALTAALVLAAAFLFERRGPDPSADVARGGEDAFLSGAYPRELSRQGPQRWAGPRARYLFQGLPDEVARLELRVRSVMTPVTVAVGGLVVGRLEPGRLALSAEVRPRGGVLDVRLLGEGRATGGRQLVALLERVSVARARPARLPARLWLLLLVPAVLALFGARVAGASAAQGLALALTAALALALALWPCGLAFSGYAREAAAGLGLALAACAGFARRQERLQPGAGAWALASLLVALGVQGLFATSPLMIVSDAVFHANKLQSVAAGDWYPTSVTQHARPFRFPYGVSFYALLVPFVRALDAVSLVRLGAALAGLVASGALFALLRAQPPRAALAVLALQALPITFDVYSYGNLSNVFAQSLTVLFFAWWAGRAPGGALLGGLLFALAALGHLSGLVVLLALAAALVLAGRGPLGGERVRLLGLALGLASAGLYYAHFSGLVLEQLPRLREGAGSGARGHLSLFGALREQALWVLVRWGWPALVLAALGRPRLAPGASLSRDLTAFWAAGLPMFLLAVASPLEVRYLYALTLPLAVAMADGLLWLARRGRAGLLAALALGAAQAWSAGLGLFEAVLSRYR